MKRIGAWHVLLGALVVCGIGYAALTPPEHDAAEFARDKAVDIKAAGLRPATLDAHVLDEGQGVQRLAQETIYLANQLLGGP